jgi:hypothetical protein
VEVQVDVVLVLWNMLRGSKLNRPSTLLATKTSWDDLFTFAKYVLNLTYLLHDGDLHFLIGS